MDQLPVTNEDRAWTAGIVDGEGCIGAYIQNGCGRTQLQVAVGNTDERMISRLEKLWGNKSWYRGKLYGGRRFWKWQTTDKRAGEFLKQIRPYLVVKGEQADLGIEFAKLVGIKGRPIVEEAKMRRLEIVGDLKELKKFKEESCPA